MDASRDTGKVYINHMKTIVIGDIHGRDIWKKIVDQSFDRVIFLGDYFDTHDNIPSLDQILNFKAICDFSLKNKGKVVMLIGNHDYHYLPHTKDRYSGYNQKYAKVIRTEILSAMEQDLLQIGHCEGKYIMTHAGVTKTWLASKREMLKDFDKYKCMICSLNKLFKKDPLHFDFYRGDDSGCGDDRRQGPLWVRPGKLGIDSVEGHIQVVGHTQMLHILIGELKNDTGVILIDTLGTKFPQYLVINNADSHEIKSVI